MKTGIGNLFVHRGYPKFTFPSKRSLGPFEAAAQRVCYAANGRDTRIHTVAIGPYLEYEILLRPDQIVSGENLLKIAPTRLTAGLAGKINLIEVELHVTYL